jgi:glyoxylase-like metal-dependent hydrolase (beta-lactamase superfamily II)
VPPLSCYDDSHSTYRSNDECPDPQLFDPVTGTGTHLVFDQPGGRAAVIDPVLDYDPKSGRTRHQNADKVLAALREHQLTLDWIMETHAHADHLSAAVYLQQQAGGKTVIGAGIAGVQQVFRKAFDLEADFVCDGSQFDHLLHDGETLPLGALHFTAIAVPGHTPADMAYQIGDAVFVGDTMFMPDVGTARCDFPAAMHAPYISRYASCWHCQPRHAYSCATITRRQVPPQPLPRHDGGRSARRQYSCA